MYKYLRSSEHDYALIKKAGHPEKNCYNHPIETVPEGSELRDKSLHINHDDGIGDSPDRYKQHGFYFAADNCIACHACEAACSEKNDLPSHIAFRSVGYVEGGSYPSYSRLNISMACNHCDDPVCLKGCPTRAYTKFAEYGAVLQDPDICFGCGYCTWVCPYNAPQLDHEAGQVEKCNMCVDRLEVGLKPACVSACLAGALDFGVIETMPENRSQLETTIPGFPTSDITHPNIRFQQTRSLPNEMKRTDSMPIRYEKNMQGDYQPEVDERSHVVQWGLKKLSTRENPLVVFTLISQLVVGAFIFLFAGPELGITTITATDNPVVWSLLLFALIGAQTLALVMSTMHLGKPHRFYRAFNNLRYSPVSREVAGIAVFYNFLGAYTLLTGLPVLFTWMPDAALSVLISISGWGATLSGLVALYFMHAIYRIPARPYWNHWSVLNAFYGSMMSLGPLLVGSLYLLITMFTHSGIVGALNSIALIIGIGLSIELIGLILHARYLKSHAGEAEASHHQQTTQFGKTYWLRNSLLMLSTLMMFMLSVINIDTNAAILCWWIATIMIIVSAILGRSLFYALVIPTTMPGAFFWKNKGFEEHARETGLASRTEAGVLVNVH
tara:strand:- start:138610 stop:140445 length:1836 start_codon:yes stop_codon:yes gene_type:complete